MKLITLSASFYERYGNCTEILQKKDRPYYCLTVEVDEQLFAIPLRHHIHHHYAFFTIDEAGLDYTKAVVIENPGEINPTPPWINTEEWRIIRKSENEIFYGFRKYVRQYKRALRTPDNPRSQRLLKYSALQYFSIR